jgi:YjbE family integral membrane protein
MEEMLTSQFWLGLGTIIWVNIILSGDNAVVIALAARSLPARQQKLAILWGAGAAVVLRIVLTVVAVKLLEYPYLKLAGGAALLWIAVQLLIPEEGGEGGDGVESSAHLLGAVKTILIADLIMSTDNVLAVAAAAKGSIVLLALGLLISIPLVIFGATMLMKLMERYPIIITLGAAILGWTAGEMAVTDPAAAQWVNSSASWLHWAAPTGAMVLVVVVGKWIAGRKSHPDENERSETGGGKT